MRTGPGVFTASLTYTWHTVLGLQKQEAQSGGIN